MHVLQSKFCSKCFLYLFQEDASVNESPNVIPESGSDESVIEESDPDKTIDEENEADESLVITKVKKKPAVICDSDSDAEEEWRENQNILKKQIEIKKLSKVDTSSDDDETDFKVR